RDCDVCVGRKQSEQLGNDRVDVTDRVDLAVPHNGKQVFAVARDGQRLVFFGGPHLGGKPVQIVGREPWVVGAIEIGVVRLADVDDEALWATDIQLGQRPFEAALELTDGYEVVHEKSEP